MTDEYISDLLDLLCSKLMALCFISNMNWFCYVYKLCTVATLTTYFMTQKLQEKISVEILELGVKTEPLRFRQP